MEQYWALIPIDASDEEVSEYGVNPSAPRQVPGVGYIASSNVKIWIGVSPVEGTISLNSAVHAPDREWRQQSDGGAGSVWVNATRLTVAKIPRGAPND